MSPTDPISLARAYARRPQLWAHLVPETFRGSPPSATPAPLRRTYALLRDDEEVIAWVICWADDHDTGWHDHDVSAGAVAVVQGCVIEERLRLGGDPWQRLAGAGEAFDFRPEDIHRVRHGGGESAVTIHVYSPPLRRQGSYAIAPDGTLRRVSLSETEELRPRATA